MNNFGWNGGFDFGGGSGGGSRGSDIEVQTDLSLKEAAHGGPREIRVRRSEPCAVCGGTGHDAGAGYDTCRDCNGAGRVRTARRTLLGTFQSVSPCQTCSGAGRIPRKKCDSCRGSGSRNAEKSISVDIPAGISEGYAIRLRGQGNHPGGSSPGDLIIHVRRVDYGPFVRQGDKLIYDLLIGFPDAALGAGADIPLVEGGRSTSRFRPEPSRGMWSASGAPVWAGCTAEAGAISRCASRSMFPGSSVSPRGRW